MSVFWIQPLAWLGVALLAIPVVIHLLARHRSRRVPFPSLQFVPIAQMAALRRRLIADWPLLIVRLLILATAVAAAAGPIVVSDSRRESWNRRIVRGIVLAHADDEVMALAAEEARTSFANAQFSGLALADAVRDATDWFREQPPGARELVIIGDIRHDAVSGRDFDVVPPNVGIRFLPLIRQEPVANLVLPTIADDGRGRTRQVRMHVSPEPSVTTVHYRADVSGTAPRIRILAPPTDEAFAEAVLRAVLREGIVLGHTDRAVTIAFAGSTAPELSRVTQPSPGWMRQVLEQIGDVRGGEVDGALVVAAAVPVTDPKALQITARVVRATYDADLASHEPRRVSPALLTQWSRPYRHAETDVLPADEGDRRWLWGATLLLMAAEQVMRRRRRVA
jgi:hypothetical protein